jgi:hypothetical protein
MNIGALAEAMRLYVFKNQSEKHKPPFYLGLSVWAHDGIDFHPTFDQCQKAYELLRRGVRQRSEEG